MAVFLERFILSTLVLFASVNIQAQTAPSCPELYRHAYLQHAKTGAPYWLEAKEIYEIYFDFSNNLDVPYALARPLFVGLDAFPQDFPNVLGEVARLMENGELCQGGKTKNFAQIVKLLRRNQ